MIYDYGNMDGDFWLKKKVHAHGKKKKYKVCDIEPADEAVFRDNCPYNPNVTCNKIRKCILCEEYYNAKKI